MKSHKQTVILILFFMTLGQMGTDIYLPSFHSIAIDLHTSISAVQLSFSVFMLAFGVSQLIYGPISDRFGRKPLLLFGTGLYCLMSLWISVSSDLNQLIIARTLQGLGAGACSVIPRAIMRDVFSKKDIQRLAIYQSLVWSLIPITAPLIGGYIQHYFGWRYNFVFLCTISAIAVLMSLKYKETLHNKAAALDVVRIINQYFNIISNRQYYPPAICAMGIISMLTAFNIASPILLQSMLGLSSVQYGWVLMGISISFMIGSFLNRFLADFYCANTIEYIGLLLLVSGSSIFFINAILIHPNIWSIIIPVTLIQGGASLIFPGCAARVMQLFPNKAGQTAALFGCSIFLAGTFTSALVSFFTEKPIHTVAAVFLVISLVMSAFLSKSHR